MDWFERLTGFRETHYEETRSRLFVEDGRLRSRANGRSWGIGTLEVVSFAELRSRAQPALEGMRRRLRVSNVVGDVRQLHADPHLRHALFQVASHFNLLEMTGPEVTPEHGVTRYEGDPTQGPACAIAAGAATIYRNYFVPVEGVAGQTSERQIDCLADVGQALGNDPLRLWDMRNGYAMCTDPGLDAIGARLTSMDEVERDDLRSRLRIGVHSNVEVTGAGDSDAHSFVSQAFCSALPVAYGRHDAAAWEPFARLLLEASYEATMWAAVLNAQATGSNTVLLTRVGGGAFGNEPGWIRDAMVRAMRGVADNELDVRLVSYGGR
jgi:hypothetical protein